MKELEKLNACNCEEPCNDWECDEAKDEVKELDVNDLPKDAKEFYERLKEKSDDEKGSFDDLTLEEKYERLKEKYEDAIIKHRKLLTEATLIMKKNIELEKRNKELEVSNKAHDLELEILTGMSKEEKQRFKESLQGI